MQTNEGLVDRAIRVTLGLALLSLLLYCPVSGWNLIGLVPLVTGLIGFCPIYTLFGIDTRGRALTKAGGG